MGADTAFQELDGQLKEAEKALQEHTRVAELLALLYHDIAQLKKDLSRAVNDLKWKTVDLRKIESFSIEAFYYRLRNRRKEWQEDVRHAHQQALSQYESCKSKLTRLEAEHEALQKQLQALAGAREQYERTRRQQLEFILKSGANRLGLRKASVQLDAARAELAQVRAVLAAGRQAAWQLDAFTDVVKDPDIWRQRNVVIADGLWALPLELFIQALVTETPESRLVRHVRLTQDRIDSFQEELVTLSRQFWPALSVKPPGELAKAAQGWLYHAQTLRSRIAAKLTWLEKESAEKERIAQELDVELGQLIESTWKLENF